MQEILIATVGCETPDDFYVALLTALGAPLWHGHNLDALWDSITRGGINSMNPPYRLRVTGISRISEGCKDMINRFVALMREAAADGIPVEIVCEP